MLVSFWEPHKVYAGRAVLTVGDVSAGLRARLHGCMGGKRWTSAIEGSTRWREWMGWGLNAARRGVILRDDVTVVVRVFVVRVAVVVVVVVVVFQTLHINTVVLSIVLSIVASKCGGRTRPKTGAGQDEFFKSLSTRPSRRGIWAWPGRAGKGPSSQ